MEIKAAEFKAKCLKLIDEVAATRESLVITKRGKPVARLAPIEAPDTTPSVFGYMAGSAEIVGDIVEATKEDWAAESGDDDPLYELISEPGCK